MSEDFSRKQAEFRRIRDEGIREEIKVLENGRQDLDAARWLLEEFRLSNPDEVPPDLFDWLSDVFLRILEGEEPDKALGMKRRRGQRKKSGKVDQLAIAMFVELQKRRGVNITQAKQDACSFFHREIDTINAAVKEVEVAPGLSDQTMWDHIHAKRKPE